MFLFSVVIGAVFSTLAALCAFVITYGEYLKHYPDKWRPFLIAVKLGFDSKRHILAYFGR